MYCPQGTSVASQGSTSVSQCVTCAAYPMYLSDIFGDGWEGSVGYIGNFGGSGFTLLGTQGTKATISSFAILSNFCLAPGSYTSYVCGGGDPTEDYWTIGGVTAHPATTSCTSGLVVSAALLVPSCNAGYYIPCTSNAVCACTTTTICTGASTCAPCVAGLYQGSTGVATTVSNCVSCAAGSYSAAGAGSCTLCPIGQYQASTGQTTCLNCPVGTYQVLFF